MSQIHGTGEPVALLIRSSGPNGHSIGTPGFRWPQYGPVTERTGHGLYGLLWGRGDRMHMSTNAGNTFQVVEVPMRNLTRWNSKARFKGYGVVVLSTTDLAEAWDYLLKRRKFYIPILDWQWLPVWHLIAGLVTATVATILTAHAFTYVTVLGWILLTACFTNIIQHFQKLRRAHVFNTPSEVTWYDEKALLPAGKIAELVTDNLTEKEMA